jgi:DNA repair protein RadA/Sms
VIAVLERRCGLSFAGQDVLVSVAGGLRIAEPAVDLPLAMALASALRDVPVALDIAAFGEVGLTGHVRPVSHAAARLREAERFGIARVVGASVPSLAGAEAGVMVPVKLLSDALATLG